eukprot:15476463-Alexandrium_andersonii.AAC.1
MGLVAPDGFSVRSTPCAFGFLRLHDSGGGSCRKPVHVVLVSACRFVTTGRQDSAGQCGQI